MEPEQNIVTPEITTTESGSSSVGVEATPVAEMIPQSAVPPIHHSEPSEESRTSDSGPFVPTQDDSVIAPEEVKDLTDSKIESADQDWVGKVRDIMHDDSGKPYKEEDDAEDLNEAYMKSRFNVDVDAPVEEK